MRSEGTKRLTMEMVMLLDLTISRCRASGEADEEVKELVRGALEASKQEITHLENLVEESEQGSGRNQKVRLRRIGGKKQPLERRTTEGDRRRHHMTDAQVKEAFERTGWAIREVSSGELVGEAGRYAIRTDEKVLGDETVFELRDEELDMKAYARRVPSPERAAGLLDRYGVPAEISDVTPGKVPMVPPGAEEDL